MCRLLRLRLGYDLRPTRYFVIVSSEANAKQVSSLTLHHREQHQ